MNVREIIAQILYTLETSEAKSHLLIREVLDKYDFLEPRDKAFIKRVTEGTIQKKITLDYVANLYSDKPVEKCKPIIRVIMRMSIYQMLFMDKVPDHAIINEAVELNKKLGRPEFSGFVNAVLRKVSQNKTAWENTLEGLSEVSRASIKYSVPEWIVSMFKKEQKDYLSLLESFSEPRKTCITIVDKGDEETILKSFDENGIRYEKSAYVENTYLADGFEGAYGLTGFSEGKILIRDESSILAALSCGVKAGDEVTVIDVCAAPGGKTTTIASKLDGAGRVISRDLSDNKVELIRENVERLKLKNVICEVHDATEFDENYREKADIVICDLPCSGLGVMGRKSDIRYKISNEIMKELVLLQRKILEVSSGYLKKGGILIYSTCTIHKAENEKMAKYICDTLSFAPDSLKEIIPVAFKGDEKEDYMIQFRPDVHHTDGFFVARFRKV